MRGWWIACVGVVGCVGGRPAPAPEPVTESTTPVSTPPPGEGKAAPPEAAPSEAQAPELDGQATSGDAPAAPALQGHRGLLRRTPDGATFTACGSEEAWTLADPGEHLKGAAAIDGSPAYAEVHLEAGQGVYTVRAVLYADPAGETQGCAMPARLGWKAAGNEPFWMLVQVEQGTVWSTPETKVRLGPLQREEESLVAKGSDHTAILVVQPVPCTDDMAGTRYSHTARVRYDGATVTGCAAAPIDPAAKVPSAGPVEPGPEHGG